MIISTNAHYFLAVSSKHSQPNFNARPTVLIFTFQLSKSSKPWRYLTGERSWIIFRPIARDAGLWPQLHFCFLYPSPTRRRQSWKNIGGNNFPRHAFSSRDETAEPESGPNESRQLELKVETIFSEIFSVKFFWLKCIDEIFRSRERHLRTMSRQNYSESDPFFAKKKNENTLKIGWSWKISRTRSYKTFWHSVAALRSLGGWISTHRSRDL